MSPCFEKKSVLGIGVSVVDQLQLLAAIAELARGGTPALVNNVNVHACNLAYEHPEFRDVLNHSEIVFCDGFGVKLAGVLTGNRLGPRMTPPDWIDDLFSMCERDGFSVYFIGDEDEVVGAFVKTVVARHPQLKVAGWRNGFFDLEDKGVVAEVSDANADIIITGMGMPRQELWAWQAKDHVDKGVFIATGALFRWYTGMERRAPRWITDCGLEWLARLVAQPRRHFRRYVVGIPLFYWRVLTSRGKVKPSE
ncbi:N-acetylglucosaminyldiphosphoundecaprenol N-acetyl-beta-D-mannosaminyltransferase [Pontiella desulfatans]|uniref:N-acetylglucosaminyldiphosphoundecaprenol N-acetyl-beta-D-mannosaminyltransferase n=1 Tax=Pontiella desulfatans TaxID=2750659 RepID=A0A6C2TX42_PONDE|nr:WecB/TagA/CpsF family glycosyltransferase [Pontiella desulfatans]VGO12173.1 N-acetylglucosaminyldiphosphoundecaprenol N-acetyl-beta-D-mannosaminyltransferase [Pontiella desulfatans]